MDYNTFFTEELRETNHEIAQYFQRTLARQIKNDIQRESRQKFTPKDLQDISFSENGNILGLENMKIISPANFDLRDLEVNFKNLSISSEFVLQNLSIEADYFAFMENFLNLCVSHRGKLSFTLKNTPVFCNIGIYNKQDSFMPINYDVNYKIGNIETKMTSYSPMGKPCEEHNNYPLKTNVQCENTTDTNHKILSLIWVEVQAYLNAIIYKLTTSVIVEFSHGELFNDEPEMIRQYESHHIRQANKTFDEYLKQYLAEYTKAAELSVCDPISTRIKLENGDYKLDISACRITDLDTMKRITDATLEETNDELICYAYVELKNFTYVLENFTVTSASEKIQGTIKVKPDSHKILLKFLKPKSSFPRVSVNLVQLNNLRIAEKHLSEHDAHAFTYISEAVKPFIRAHARYHANQVLQRLAASLNKCYETNN